MADRLTSASFFSGVGGMDIGLERAGWRTVSFSEIDPYASSVLAARWPEVPNLGDITQLDAVPEPVGTRGEAHLRDDWRSATLWTGGFPCQDLSRAGNRLGWAGERSVLAFAFLDIVDRWRPEAFILENVPGLLTSNDGRDFGRLAREVGELGYGWAYRVFDAAFFGVPQRRRRVFFLALDLARHPDPDSAAEVLSVGKICGRDHHAERAVWAQAGRGTARTASGRDSQTNDPSGMRTPDGLAGRLDAPGHYPAFASWVKHRNAMTSDDYETWARGDMSPTLTAVAFPRLLVTDSYFGDDAAALPPSADGNRLRAIGNGVVAPVAEWVGRRLAGYLHEGLL